MIRRNVQQMQRWFIDKDPLFEHCIVPSRRLHSSLLLTSIPEHRRDEAREACHEAGVEIRTALGSQPVKLICSSMGCFNGQVLFARIRTEPREILQAIHDILARSFMRHNFPVLDETAKAWLDEGAEPRDFQAHASFLKVSKAMAHAEDRSQFKNLRVTADDLEVWRDVFFGSQLCYEFELLDMLGMTRDGYYPRLQLERFHDLPANANIDHAAHSQRTSGPLRTAILRVASGDVGAGLELSMCSGGYYIESIADWPGQPSLKESDTIVAIDGTLLLDFEDEMALEKCFQTHFFDGATIVVGGWSEIERYNTDLVRQAALGLLKQCPHVPDVSAEVFETSSVDTYSRVLQPGLRYHLRSIADDFVLEVDPLSQPGGDPWAKAADEGWSYPAYTGWGTNFKTTHASKVQSHPCIPKAGKAKSLRFIPRAVASIGNEKRVQHDEFCERTRVHKDLQGQIAVARSQFDLLHFAHANRYYLSMANRAFIFDRLLALGTWLQDDLRAGDELRGLLQDLLEDLSAAEEAGSKPSASLLAKLVYALGRLGIKDPDIFRTIRVLVRRVGLWTFEDGEVAMLLEGLSRAKLSDEIIFQEAARYILARLPSISHNHLTTMLTAFACSNISTDHLFFAVGDEIMRDKAKSYSLASLAELADAFARVKARHALLVEHIPEVFYSGAHAEGCLYDRRRCSAETLVHLLSAYVDAEKHDLGPEGFRDAIAEALCARESELTARLARLVLQAVARAHWPRTDILELVSHVAKKDPKPWELEAMETCFESLRVLPPSDFPLRGAVTQGHEMANVADRRVEFSHGLELDMVKRLDASEL
eukprot:TRINITY_DN46424_c0_g1_i1.p1 TRINITY_DN46424_c0_g1~~TRINITY_DN46424_c0_g1_i1.p1  ORF type:complete len:822 (-),score=113.55 TRINITY_DN46424_c0_g1_i1:117-2582(-)